MFSVRGWKAGSGRRDGRDLCVPTENTMIEDRLHMRQLRNLLARYLTVFLFFLYAAVYAQTPESMGAASEQNPARPFHNNVRTILLLTSYPDHVFKFHIFPPLNFL